MVLVNVVVEADGNVLVGIEEDLDQVGFRLDVIGSGRGKKKSALLLVKDAALPLLHKAGSL